MRAVGRELIEAFKRERQICLEFARENDESVETFKKDTTPGANRALAEYKRVADEYRGKALAIEWAIDQIDIKLGEDEHD